MISIKIKQILDIHVSVCVLRNLLILIRTLPRYNIVSPQLCNNMEVALEILSIRNEANNIRDNVMIYC